MIKQTKLHIAAIENGDAKMVTEESRKESEGIIVDNDNCGIFFNQVCIFRQRNL